MSIIVRNPTLHREVFKKMDYYDKKAMFYYKNKNMKLGNKYELLSDKLYKKYYKKMFKIKY